MAPEMITTVIVLDLAIEGDRVVATRHLASLMNSEEFLVKWYPLTETPKGFQSVAGGVIFVPEQVEVAEERGVTVECTERGCRYRDHADMLVLLLPRGRALSWNDTPWAAKAFKGRVAVYWLRASSERLMDVVWSLPVSDADAPTIAADMSAFLEEARGEIPRYSVDNYARYDVALSYASEDRPRAEELATMLKRAGKRVFFDHDARSRLWGKMLGPQLEKIYSTRATFCVLFVSEHYRKKRWTQEELRAAVKEAEKKQRDYILPVQLDETRLEELPEDLVYVPIGLGSQAICAGILEKLARL